MANPLERLASLNNEVGDIARAQISNDGPTPLETPDETRLRQDQEQRSAVQSAARTSADLASRGIPSYRDTDGTVQPVRDSEGAALTNFDKGNKIAYDSTGNPQRIEYGESGAPELRDPFQGVQPTTDPKTGDQYKITPGLPWQWVGKDQDVSARATARETEKEVGRIAQVTGQKLSLDQHEMIAAEKTLKNGRKELGQLVPDFGTNPELTGAFDSGDQAKVLQHIDDYYNTQFAAKDANATDGWFGSGSLNPEAVARRQEIEAQKSTARDKAVNLMNLNARLGQIRPQVQAGREQMNDLRTQQLQARIAQLPPELQAQFAQHVQQGSQPTAPDGNPVAAHIEAAKNGQKAYKVDDKDQLTLDPTTPLASIDQAEQDGLLAPDKATALRKQMAPIQQKAMELKKLGDEHPELSKVLATLHGASDAAAFWGGGTATAGALSTANIGLAGAVSGVATPLVGGAVGGIAAILEFLAGGTVATWLKHKVENKLAEYSDAVKMFTDSAEAQPTYDAGGNIAGIVVGAGVSSIPKLVRATSEAYAAFAANPATAANAGKLAAAALGGQVAKGAVAGAAFEGAIRPGFDAARYAAADAMGVEHDPFQAPTVGSVAESTGLGMLASGMGLKFPKGGAQPGSGPRAIGGNVVPPGGPSGAGPSGGPSGTAPARPVSPTAPVQNMGPSSSVLAEALGAKKADAKISRVATQIHAAYEAGASVEDVAAHLELVPGLLSKGMDPLKVAQEYYDKSGVSDLTNVQPAPAQQQAPVQPSAATPTAQGQTDHAAAIERIEQKLNVKYSGATDSDITFSDPVSGRDVTVKFSGDPAQIEKDLTSRVDAARKAEDAISKAKAKRAEEKPSHVLEPGDVVEHNGTKFEVVRGDDIEVTLHDQATGDTFKMGREGLTADVQAGKFKFTKGTGTASTPAAPTSPAPSKPVTTSSATPSAPSSTSKAPTAAPTATQSPAPAPTQTLEPQPQPQLSPLREALKTAIHGSTGPSRVLDLVRQARATGGLLTPQEATDLLERADDIKKKFGDTPEYDKQIALFLDGAVANIKPAKDKEGEAEPTGETPSDSAPTVKGAPVSGAVPTVPQNKDDSTNESETPVRSEETADDSSEESSYAESEQPSDESGPEELADEERTPSETRQESTRSAIEAGKKEHEKATQAVGVTYDSHEAPEGSSGFQNHVGRILIDENRVSAMAERVAANGADADKWVRFAHDEEVSHSLFQASYDNPTTAGEAISRALSKNARVALRQAYYGDMNDFAVGAEYVRMLDQYRRTGHITEDFHGNKFTARIKSFLQSKNQPAGAEEALALINAWRTKEPKPEVLSSTIAPAAAPERMMGIPVKIARSEDIDGTRFELFEGDKGSVIRTTDIDSGKAIGITKYPDNDKGRSAYQGMIAMARSPITQEPAPSKAPEQRTAENLGVGDILDYGGQKYDVVEADNDKVMVVAQGGNLATGKIPFFRRDIANQVQKGKFTLYSKPAKAPEAPAPKSEAQPQARPKKPEPTRTEPAPEPQPKKAPAQKTGTAPKVAENTKANLGKLFDTLSADAPTEGSIADIQARLELNRAALANLSALLKNFDNRVTEKSKEYQKEVQDRKLRIQALSERLRQIRAGINPGSSLNADAPEERDQIPIPRTHQAALIEVANNLMDDGINTPEMLAAVLMENVGPKARKYSQALWDMMGSLGAVDRGTHDWNKVYAQLSQADTGTSTGDAPESIATAQDASPAAPAPSFAEQVNRAARATNEKTQRLGPRKAYIADVWRVWQQQTGNQMPLEEFKRTLLKEARQMNLSLSRLDFYEPGSESYRKGEESKISDGDETFNFVTIPDAPATPTHETPSTPEPTQPTEPAPQEPGATNPQLLAQPGEQAGVEGGAQGSGVTVPESETYQRSTPAPGTPERADLEQKHRLWREQLDEADAKIQTAEKDRDKRRKYSKPWDQANATLSKLRNEKFTLDQASKSVREQMANAYREDTATTAVNPLRRIDALAKLGVIKHPIERKKEMALSEAQRQGLSESEAKSVADHAAQFTAFKNEETLEKAVATSARILGDERRRTDLFEWLDSQNELTFSDKNYLKSLVSQYAEQSEVDKVREQAKKRIETAKAERQKKEAEERAKQEKENEVRAQVRSILESDKLPGVADLPEGKRIAEATMPRGAVQVHTANVPKWRKTDDIIAALSPAAGNDVSRFVLASVYIDNQNGKKMATATDGRMMVTVPYSGNLEPAIYSTGQLKTAPSGGKIYAKGEVVDGNYPNYRQVIPNEKPKAKLPITDEMIGKALQAHKISRLTERGQFLIRFEVKGAQGVFLNPDFFASAVESLRKAGFDNLVLEIVDSMSPVVIRSKDNKDAQAIIMPMRMEDDYPHVLITDEQPAPKAQKAPAPAPAAPEPAPAPEPQAPAQGEAQEPLTPITNLANFDAFVDKLRNGEVTADQVKAAWEQYKANEPALREELGKKTKDELLRLNGMHARPSDSKAQLIEGAISGIEAQFQSDVALSYGMITGDMKKAKRAAMDKSVAGWTDEQIQKNAQERREKIEARKKALTNPETLEEFEQYVFSKGKASPFTDKEKAQIAKLKDYRLQDWLMRRGESKLTPEQLAKYDELRGIDRKAEQQQAQERKAFVQGVRTNVSAEIVPTKHTQTGADLYVVRLAERVERDVYDRLNSAAKKLGGHYSSYAKNGAIPGFTFKSNEAAEQFLAITKGEGVDRSEEVQEQREEKKSAAAGRLRKIAQGLENKAEEVLNAERKTNTARRANMAAGIEDRALGDKAFAETLRNLADGMDRGDVTLLDNIRNRAQVETLAELVRLAQLNFSRTMDSGRDSQNARDRQPELSDIEHAEYPYPYMDKSTLLKMVDAGRNTDGAKLLAERVAKIRMTEHQGESTRLRDPQDVENVRELAKKVFEYGKPMWETVAWKFGKYDHLQQLGFTDLPMLRAALREYLQFRKAKGQEDPIKKAERELIGAKIPGFFPTPKPLVDRMVEEAEIQPGMRVLEPSAGKGDIADAIREAHPDANLQMIEWNGRLREILVAKGHNVIESEADFLKHYVMDSKRHDSRYDRIVMNPPFENGQDIEHVMHAFSLLKPGGRLVAIMSEGPFFRSDKKAVAFREWLEAQGGTSEQNPEGSFAGGDAFRQTGTNTRLVVIEKPEAAQEPSAPVEQVDPEIQELREDLGVSDKAALDAYDPEQSARKLGSKWLYVTLEGKDAPALYDTKREAIEAATKHKELKEAYYQNPRGFRDITSVRARKSLALIEKYMAQGMSEMEAGKRAKAELESARAPESRGETPATETRTIEKESYEMTPTQFYDWNNGRRAVDAGISRAEVDRLYPRESSYDDYWDVVHNAARNGKKIPAIVLDKLEKMNREYLVKHFEKSVPDGYIFPEAREMNRQHEQEMRDARKRGAEAAKQSPSTQPEARPATNVLHTEPYVKLNAPKSATFIRVVDSKGRETVETIKNVTKGRNVLQGAGPYQSVQVGTKDGKGRFVPMDETVGAEPVQSALSADAPTSLRERLEAAWANDDLEAMRPIARAVGLDPSIVDTEGAGAYYVLRHELNSAEQEVPTAPPTSAPADYTQAAQQVYASKTAPAPIEPTVTERRKITLAYRALSQQQQRPSVEIADVMEKAGFKLGDMPRAKGLLVSMYQNGDITTLATGDWSLSDERKRAWGVRTGTGVQDIGLLMRMSEDGGRLSADAPTVREIAKGMNVRYDGQIEVPGVERHQFTIENPDSPAHKATFIVRGEPTEQAIRDRVEEKEAQFAQGLRVTAGKKPGTITRVQGNEATVALDEGGIVRSKLTHLQGETLSAAPVLVGMIDSVFQRFDPRKGFRFFWEGTADVLERGGFKRLAKQTWVQKDQEPKQVADAMAPQNKVLNGKFTKDEMEQGRKEWAIYFRHAEVARGLRRRKGKEQQAKSRQAQADSFYQTMSPAGRALIEAWKDTAELTGDRLESHNVMVEDGDHYRPLKKMGRDFFPRKINKETRKVLDDTEKYPQEWAKLAQDLVDNGNINDISEADEYRREHIFKKTTQSDYYANMEQARKMMLPESWLEYRWEEIVPWYVTNYGKRMAQIIAYGQNTDTQKDLWGQTLDSLPTTPDLKYTREYIQAAEAAAKFERYNSTLHQGLKNLQTVATASFLSSPFSAIRNFISGTTQTAVVFGPLEAIKQTYKAMTDSLVLLDAHERGVIRQDIFALRMQDAQGEEETSISRTLRKIAGEALRVTGFNWAEDIVRSANMLAAASFVRKGVAEVTKDAGSAKAKQFIAVFRRMDADILKLITENAQGFKGEPVETERFLRRAVTEMQGGYSFTQTPLHMSEPLIGFLTQFQKWGTQMSRFLAKHVINPLVHGTEYDAYFVAGNGGGGNWNGQKGRFTLDPNSGGIPVKVKVRSVRPFLYVLLFAILGGEALYALKELLTGRRRADATLEEIANNKDQPLEQAGLIAGRLLSDVIMGGTLGMLSDYGGNFRELATRGRFKNPLDPPGLQFAKNIYALTVGTLQQGTMHMRDVLDALYKQAPGLAFAERLTKRVIGEKVQDARNVAAIARDAGNRAADQLGMPKRGSFGSEIPTKTPSTAFYNDLEDALLTGDTAQARLLIAERLRGKSLAERDKLFKAMKSSVSSSAPVRIGGIASAANRQLFFQWAGKHLPAEDLTRIRNLDRNYWSTAQRVGLSDGEPVPKQYSTLFRGFTRR